MAARQDPIQELAEALSRFPGLGKKSSLRLVYHLLRQPAETAQRLGRMFLDLHTRVLKCRICRHYSSAEICPICSDPSRDRKTICVVEQDQDLLAIEESRLYRGLYHVMHGLISPQDGIGADDLGLNFLRDRVEREGIEEVIVATNPTLEGDTTALYIARLLRGFENVKITRLATGLPVGGDLEYADRRTIGRSFQARLPLVDKEGGD